MLTGSGNLVTHQNKNLLLYVIYYKFSVPSLKFLHKDKNKREIGRKIIPKKLIIMLTHLSCSSATEAEFLAAAS